MQIIRNREMLVNKILNNETLKSNEKFLLMYFADMLPEICEFETTPLRLNHCTISHALNKSAMWSGTVINGANKKPGLIDKGYLTKCKQESGNINHKQNTYYLTPKIWE